MVVYIYFVSNEMRRGSFLKRNKNSHVWNIQLYYLEFLSGFQHHRIPSKEPGKKQGRKQQRAKDSLRRRRFHNSIEGDGYGLVQGEEKPFAFAFSSVSSSVSFLVRVIFNYNPPFDGDYIKLLLLGNLQIRSSCFQYLQNLLLNFIRSIYGYTPFSLITKSSFPWENLQINAYSFNNYKTALYKKNLHIHKSSLLNLQNINKPSF